MYATISLVLANIATTFPYCSIASMNGFRRFRFCRRLDACCFFCRSPMHCSRLFRVVFLKLSISFFLRFFLNSVNARSKETVWVLLAMMRPPTQCWDWTKPSRWKLKLCYNERGVNGWNAERQCSLNAAGLWCGHCPEVRDLTRDIWLAAPPPQGYRPVKRGVYFRLHNLKASEPKKCILLNTSWIIMYGTDQLKRTWPFGDYGAGHTSPAPPVPSQPSTSTAASNEPSHTVSMEYVCYGSVRDEPKHCGPVAANL